MAYEPLGGEFLVNTSTSGDQLISDVTALVGGGYVICWSDPNGDGSGYSVKAQLIGSDGTLIGGEFLVNSATLADQKIPTVAALDNGGFAISWYDYSNQTGDSSGSGVIVRVYGSDGTAATSEILVNTTTTNDQVEPYVAGLTGGGFVVTWIDYSNEGGDTSVSAVRAQVFASDGTAVGGEILVNTETNHYQIQPQISGLENGNFVITWTDRSGIGGDASNFGVKAQLFASDGTKIGGEFLVNTELPNEQSDPTVTGLVGGGFVITWNDHSGLGGDPSGWGIRAQIYDANGTPIGGEFVVNTVTFDEQQGPTVAALPDGGFVISWMDYAGTFGGAGGGIKAQVFAADGTPVGGEFTVNTIDDNRQLYPDIAAQADGSFLITWTSNGAGGDGDGYGIKAQLYESDSPPANIAPVLDLDADDSNTVGTGYLGAYTESGAASAIADTDVMIIDADAGDDIVSAVIAILNPETGDKLNVGALPAGITVDGSSTDTTVILVGAPGTSANDFETAIEAVTFSSTSDDPTDGGTNASRTVTVTVNDGANDSNVATATITVTDPPDEVTGYAPVGGEFVVNGDSEYQQHSPSVTDLATGGFVVVWQGNGIRAQVFGADGIPVGEEFAVASGGDAEVTSLEGGGFAVGWYDGSGIKAQMFAADGTPDGDAFPVNVPKADLLYQPTITSLSGGGIVVSWTDQSGDGSQYGVRARIFDPSGNPVGTEFLVNTVTSSAQVYPTITGLTGGGFVASWADYSGIGGDNDHSGIKAQIFAADGTPVGGEFLVNTATQSEQGHPTITALSNGGFVVSWFDYSWQGGDPDQGAVKAQVYAADGTPVGGELLVNTTTAGQQGQPSVAALSDGGFVVAWMDGSNVTPEDPDWDIRAQAFDADGSKVGGEILVNTVTEFYQNDPSVSGLSDGGFVVTWADFSVDPNFGSAVVKAQIFGPETGDTSAPAVAQDDAFTTNELNSVTGNLFADNGSGADSDPDGPALTITEVNGSAANVGVEITLPSGAKLTVNADGSFSYDPNGAFEQTPTYGSGAFNTPAADTFSYTLAGGDSATVVFTIDGVDNDDVIIGSENNDRLIGGTGDDQIFGLEDADYITGGFGDDTIDGGDGAYDRAGWYQTNESLGGATVDLNITEAQYTGSQGWDTISGIENLSGTPFSDNLTGDGNDNWLWGSGIYLFGEQISSSNNDMLDGQGGNDLLTVGSGNHTLIGGADSDTVRYTENGGPEVGIVLDLNAQGAAQDSGAGSWTLTGIENLASGDGDDVLIGDGNANVLAGAAGSDFLDGGAGNDRLYGDGTIAVDSLSTGPITEFPEVSRSVNDVPDGNDVLNGGSGDDILYGGGGNDTLTGNSDNDALYGGDGNDFLRGNFGNDSLDGGEGFDRIGYFNGSTSGVTVDLRIETAQNVGEQGFDTITNVEAVSGTVFADNLTGNDQDNWLWGSISGGGADNNDYLDGQGGNDLLTIGAGNHTLIGGADNDTLEFSENGGPEAGIAVALWDNLAQDTGAGTWTLSGIENLFGGIGNDSLEGDDLDNIIGGSLGDDALFGYGGNDTLYGDGVVGTVGNVPTTFVDSGSEGGNDQLSGGGGDDTLYGGAGNDGLRGAVGNDQLYAGEGNDFLNGGVGNDLIDGGDGIDRAGNYHTDELAGGVTIDLNNAGQQDTGSQGIDTFVGIENLSGTPFADTLIGDGNANWLWGSAATIAVDWISASNDDYLDGQGGNDLLTVGIGNHTLIGGADNDTLNFSENGGAEPDIAVALWENLAQDTGAGIWTLSGIENLFGGIGNDSLEGDDADNIVGGSLGDDGLFGYGGNDTLYGDGYIYVDNAQVVHTEVDAGSEGGNDQLFGGGGNDILYGGAGNDALRGGADNDAIYGGYGDDVIVGGFGDDLIDGGEGYDRAGNYHVDESLGGVTIDLNITGAQNTGSQGWDTIVGIEYLSGTPFADVLIGDANDNVLWGSVAMIDPDTNWISTTNNDTLEGGDGNDLLYVGIGNHSLTGGTGNDTVGFTENWGDDPAIRISLALQGIAQDTGQGLWTLSGIENLSGGNDNDELTGDGNANILAGAYGNDALSGGGGDDSLYGDGAIDSGAPSSGPPTLFPNVGADGSDTLDGGDGDDQLHGGGGNDILVGGAGADLLDGGDGRDLANYGPGSGPVTVDIGAGTATRADGNDSLIGIEDVLGSGEDDLLIGDGDYNVLNGGGGNDVIDGAGGDDTLMGGDGNDQLYGNSGNDQLIGGLGDDVIDGGADRDVADYQYAAGGVTALLYGGGFGEAFGADGYDQLHNIEDLNGSAFNDILYGDEAANMVVGNDGHDDVRGFDGNDNILGGTGDDLLYGNGGDDYLDGGDGYDRVGYFSGATTGVTVDLNLQGVAQDTGQGMDVLVNIENVSGTQFGDTLTGDDNDNVIWGSAATLNGVLSTENNDTLSGGGGNDLLIAGIGNHAIDGGEGIDTFRFTENGVPETGITLSLLLAGQAQASGNGSWTLTGIENLSGSISDDQLTGDANANVLAGDLGDDTLRGGDGDDTLYGDGQINWDAHGVGRSGPITTIPDATSLYVGGVAGNDWLEGGLGDDTLDGGDGIDTAGYINAAGSVTVNLASGFAGGADGNDTLSSIENAYGSQFNDTLNGSFGNNVLDGQSGNDTLVGANGDDALFGGDGDDFLQGDFGDNNITASGNDFISGDDGNDNLRGGLGDDQLFGGANNDLLRGNGGVDYFDGGADDGEGPNGIGDRVSFFEQRATQGVIADLRTGVISNDGFGNVETMVGIESLGGDTAYSDTFHGDDNRNALIGGLGDNLFGHGGDDLIQTGAAATIVDGGSGTDNLILTTGVGGLTPDSNGDGLAEFTTEMESGWTIDLQIGTAIDGYGNSGALTGIENVLGSVLGDSITGDSNTNVLFGGFGNDTLDGGDGDDELWGGGGSDTASYASAGGDVTALLYDDGFGEAFGAAGYDQLHDIENLSGSAFNDILYANSLDNIVSGGDGHDDVRGGAGNDQVFGDAGDDLLYGNAGDDYLDGGDGYDRAGFFSGAVTGVTVDLNLQGVAQDTGQGMDILVNIENLSGTQFADTLIGDDNDNFLWGSAATVSGVVSPDNNDTLIGNGGNDLLIAGIGNHVIDGGSGTDTFRFTENGVAETGITLSLALQGAAQDSGNGSWVLTNIENLSGSISSDNLSGDANDNVLAGDLGNDILSGGSGNDTLYGDGQISWDAHGITGRSGPITTYTDATSNYVGAVAGNDVLEGGLGDDWIDGGGGFDTASYANASGGVQIFLSNNTSGNGSASGADGDDLLFAIENLTGSAFADNLTGSAAANVLIGGGGNDFLQARGGDDSVYGGDGNDYLGGGTGNDLLDGGAGWDRASFSNGASGPVHVDLRIQGVAQDTGLGMDTLIGIENANGTAFADTFIGNDGENWLWGGNDSAGTGDTIDGQGGDDLIEDGMGDHNLDGGTGIDTFSFNPFTVPTSATISLALQGAAQDTGAGIMTLNGFENLSGSSFSDTLIGDGNANVLAGGEAGDTLIGGAGNDMLYGDGAFGTDGSPSGPITVFSDLGPLGGIDGDDIIEGGLGDDVIDGGGGTDTANYANASGGVTVNLATGTSSGADGSDTLAGIENATGGAFNDTLTGNGVANVLAGGDGHDALSGAGGDDGLQGGDGNDSLTGGVGDDIIDGGAGFDRANYNVGATAGVTVNLSLTGAQSTGQGSDTLLGIEHLVGTTFNDVLTGSDGDNWIWGGSLGTGVTGNDTISGGNGNDLIEVGTGNHTLNGGGGTNDTLSFWGGGTDVTSTGVAFNLATTAAQNTRQGSTSATGFENLSGSRYGDALTGNTQDNILAGNTGNDTLNGGIGSDTLYGDGGYTTFTAGGLATGPIRLVADVTTEFGGVAGNDILNGGDGDDFLYGGGGNDVMKGDKDNDTLYGGAGNDSLVGGQGNDLYVIEANSGADTISGFTHVDKIVFDTSSGVTSFSQLTLSQVGGTNTLVTWGNGNSILIEGFKPKDITAADFQFPAPASLASFSTQEDQRVLAGSTGDTMVLAAVAASGLLATTSVTPMLASSGTSDDYQSSLEGSTQSGVVEPGSNSEQVRSFSVDEAYGSAAETAGSFASHSTGSFDRQLAPTSQDSQVSAPAELLEATQLASPGLPASSGAMAMGVTFPSGTELALAAAHGNGLSGGADAVATLADGNAKLPALLDGIVSGDSASIDALLDALPGGNDPMSSLATLAHVGVGQSAWVVDSGSTLMLDIGQMMATHHDAVGIA